jgi:phosphatidylglycerophosphatase A
MRGKAALVLATWFGCGLAPLAPGTIGTLAAVPLVLAFHRLALPLRAGALAAVVMVAIWSAGVCEKILDRRDPKVIVIDEVVGFLLTMAFLPLSALSFWLGLALFRFFDIAKPFPIRTIDRNVQGGLGVVADDLVAGVFAGCTTMAAMGMGRWLN